MLHFSLLSFYLFLVLDRLKEREEVDGEELMKRGGFVYTKTCTVSLPFVFVCVVIHIHFQQLFALMLY